ncbi:MAG: ABC transporter permease [Janthinobacterium lividum]
MLRYVVGRVAQALLVLWAAYTVTFVVLYLLPSDPVALMLSANDVQLDSLTPDQIAAARARFGLDQPIHLQYLHLLVRALHGDLGTSLTAHVPVTRLLASRLPPTLVLSLVAVVLAVVGGVGLASLAAYVQWRPARLLLTRLPSLGVSLPTFWVGLLLIQVFAFTLHWVPATGDLGWRSIVLPAVTMAIPTSASLAQVLTRSLRDTLDEPYVTTARAKGLSRFQVQLRHASRNAALPTLTILGLLVGATVTGAVTVETVFSRIGVGRLAAESVLAQDIPVVQGIVVVAAVAFVLVNLLVDLLYPLIDPRVVHAPKVVRP